MSSMQSYLAGATCASLVILSGTCGNTSLPAAAVVAVTATVWGPHQQQQRQQQQQQQQHSSPVGLHDHNPGAYHSCVATPLILSLLVLTSLNFCSCLPRLPVAGWGRGLQPGWQARGHPLHSNCPEPLPCEQLQDAAAV